ncbi:MAG TPA: Gfo/Idh/MocA family oxidoreductase [Devosiaceae bacterium]|nr:Gfo/Idh/MocA family oxidoreductase [Devosiaceae bacterium]
MTTLRLGIVGCGEVAQIIHLPALGYLGDKFSVTALCDISPKVLEEVAATCGSPACYSDYRDLIASEHVDAVLVTNPHAYHAEVAIAALDAGKHVLIEKPMCMTLAEADALQAAQDRSGRVVQIGYMRRYSGTFMEAVKHVRAMGDSIRFARVQDVIGKNRLIIDNTSRVIRDPDLPEDQRAALKRLEEQKIAEAIGEGKGDLAITYALLLGLGSHDISAMREIIGRPKNVISATHRSHGRRVTATFDYGPFVCEFATGVDQLPRFDTYLEVYGDDKVIRIDYDTPYIRNLPARLTVTTAHGEAGVSQDHLFPSRLDSFVVEWEAFYDSVTAGVPTKTSIADAREDLEIFVDIIDAIRMSNAQRKGN